MDDARLFFYLSDLKCLDHDDYHVLYVSNVFACCETNGFSDVALIIIYFNGQFKNLKPREQHLFC